MTDQPVSRVERGIDVMVADRSGEVELNAAHWAEVAEQTLLGEGITYGELGLTFVDVDEMAALNLEHMGKPGPTDVLAFPMDIGPDGVPPMSTDDPQLPVAVGDIVICPEVARRQAPEHSGSLPAELTLLVIHGALHLLGHDHYEQDETIVMQGREQHHMARHGFSHPEFDR